MESYRTKGAYSGTYANPMTRGSYETVNSGSCKTWNDRPHYCAKRVGNKVGGYASAYAPSIYRNKTVER